MNRLTHLNYGLIALGLNLFSCASSKDTMQRYSNRSEPKPKEICLKAIPQFIRVDVSSFTVIKPTPPAAPIEKELPRLFTSLAPQAQQEIIKTLAPSTKPTALLKIVGDPLPSTAPSPTPAPTSFNRIIPKQITKRFVIAVSLPIDGRGLADRLAEIQYSIYVGDEPAVFNTWDSFESKYGVINLGKVSSSSGMELKAAIDAKVGSDASPFNLGPSAGATFNNKYETSRELTDKILLFSGILREKEMVFNQRGEQGSNIEGNSSVVVECETTADWAKPVTITKVKKLYTGNNQWPVMPDSLKLETGLILFPNVEKDVIGKLKYNFSYRQIVGRSRSASEAKQRVAIWHGEVSYPKGRLAPGDTIGSDTRTIVLLRKKDFYPVTYQLCKDKTSLALGGSILNFDTSAEAADFLEYLYKYFGKAPIVNHSLKLGAVPMSSADLPVLLVKTVED